MEQQLPEWIDISEKIGKTCEWVGMYSWSRDGEKIAFSARTEEGTNIYVMDVYSEDITQITEGPFQDNNPSFAPYYPYRIAFDSNRDTNGNADGTSKYGEHYIYTIKNDDILRSDNTTRNDDSKLKKLIKVLGEYPSCQDPVFHPEYDWLLYSTDMSNEWLVNLAHNVRKRI